MLKKDIETKIHSIFVLIAAVPLLDMMKDIKINPKY